MQADQGGIAPEQEAARLRAEAELAAGQREEKLRQLRARDGAIASIAEVENERRAGDERQAAQAFEQAEKRLNEKGMEGLQPRLNRCSDDLAMLSELDRIDNDIWTVMNGKAFTWEAIFPRAGLSLFTQQAPAWNKLGLALRGTGDRPDAIAALREAVRINPNSAEALNNLGIALGDDGAFVDGIECLREATRLE